MQAYDCASSSNERANLFTSVRSCHTNPCWKGERFVWTFIQMNALTAILSNLTNLYHLQRRLMGKSTLWCPSNQVHPVKRYIPCLKGEKEVSCLILVVCWGIVFLFSAEWRHESWNIWLLPQLLCRTLWQQKDQISNDE